MNKLFAMRAPFLSISNCEKFECTHFGEPSPLFLCGCISVHRRGAHRTHPVSPVPSQPMKHSKYVFVGRLVERLVRQLYGQVQEVIVVHAGIIGARCGGGHSYFPRGS